MNILHVQWKDFQSVGDGGIILVRIEEDNSSDNNYSVKQISLAAQPIRSTTQIWVVTCHQYGISELVSQTSFRDETSDGVEKCWLISQGIIFVRHSWASEIREGTPLENEGLLIVSHQFFNGLTNRACSRWSDSGLWREVSEREKVRGRRGRGREKGMLSPYPTPRCFSCSHLSHFLHCPTIWTAVTRLRFLSFLTQMQNYLHCNQCDGKHRRYSTDRFVLTARYCSRCNTRHAAKEVRNHNVLVSREKFSLPSSIHFSYCW